MDNLQGNSGGANDETVNDPIVLDALSYVTIGYEVAAKRLVELRGITYGEALDQVMNEASVRALLEQVEDRPAPSLEGLRQARNLLRERGIDNSAQ